MGAEEFEMKRRTALERLADGMDCDAGKPTTDCPYTGEQGNLNMRNFR